MVGWSRRAQERAAWDKAWRAEYQRHLDGLFIRQALGEQLMPADLAGLREEVILRLLGKAEAEKHFEREHVEDMQGRRMSRRTLRCLLLGCVSRKPCRYWPTCTWCSGACRRCGRSMVAPARALP